jgi:pilus assembly protein TadC
VAALLAAPVVAVLLRRLQARQHPGAARHELARTPMVLDLVAVVLAAGQPVAAALRVAAPSAGPWLGHQLEQVAGLLRLGAEPAEAWGVLAGEPALRPVVLAAVRSSGSGIRLAGAFTELAVELRAVARAAAQARAQRAGVWSIAPLGLCFLPAFVCIGIVPVVIGVAGDILIGLVA